MQEIFENMLKDAYDQMIKDRDEQELNVMIQTTDVVALLKHVKLQRALAENHRLGVEREIRDYKEGDPSDEHTLDHLVREASDFARIVETFDYVIDVIESGKYAKE